jgi:hypothetical protein
MPDEEFDVLGEDELALLTRRFERLHENWVNMRRNKRTCFKCGKTGHYFAECPKVNTTTSTSSWTRGRIPRRRIMNMGRRLGLERR